MTCIIIVGHWRWASRPARLWFSIGDQCGLSLNDFVSDIIARTGGQLDRKWTMPAQLEFPHGSPSRSRSDISQPYRCSNAETVFNSDPIHLSPPLDSLLYSWYSAAVWLSTYLIVADNNSGRPGLRSVERMVIHKPEQLGSVGGAFSSQLQLSGTHCRFTFAPCPSVAVSFEQGSILIFSGWPFTDFSSENYWRDWTELNWTELNWTTTMN